MGEYRVVSVNVLSKNKYKIALESIETVIMLSLYSSEVRKYNIVEDGIITDEIFGELCDLLYKRGKERALYYLKTADKTTHQMRTKLKEGFYPTQIIDRVISFLQEYGYIDDYRYAMNFVDYNKNKKSVKRLKNDLSLKGISRHIIETVLEEILEGNDDTEYNQIELYCRKKIKTDMDEKQCNRIIMALMRKGFKYEQVRSVFNTVLEETNT